MQKMNNLHFPYIYNRLSQAACWTLTILFALNAGRAALAQPTKPLEHLWEVDPGFGDIWVQPTFERVLRFRIADIDSPSLDRRMHVARMICREHNNGLFKERDQARDLLLKRLDIGESNVQVLRAMVSAAVLLCDAGHAPQLWKASQADRLAQTMVEQALVQWGSKVAIEEWRSRLDAENQRESEIGLALSGLSAVGDTSDQPRIRRILLGNRTSDPNRVLAAKALGTVASSELNDLADQLLESNLRIKHLLSAHLISKHSGSRTLKQAERIMSEGPSEAQRIAYQILIQHDLPLARKLAVELTKAKDSHLRRSALDVLDGIGDESSVRLQGQLLADPNRDIRLLVTDQMLQHAVKHRAVVDSIVSQFIQGESWEGIERAIVIATKLNDHSRIQRFVELLDHSRPDVYLHAAWGLMEIANEPEVLDRLYQRTLEMTDHLDKRMAPNYELSQLIHLSYLLECLGKNHYEACHDMLLKYVPKNDYKMGNVSRTGAIWALGKLNRGKPNPSLRDALEERVADISSLNPEEYLVRYAAVLALGEMADPLSRETLEKFKEPFPMPLAHACTWALKRLEATDKAE